MPTRCGMKAQEDKINAFWNQKALKYPLPFDNGALRTTNIALSIIKKRGVDLKSKRILDIGCGTGIYTLPLSNEALSVIGIDFSTAMIERLNVEKNKRDIKNVEAVCASWKDFDIKAAGFEKVFDIVLTSMSMAVRDEHDVKKMEECSRKWCVHIGWGRKRQNALMEEVFSLHNMVFAPPAGSQVMYNIVNGMSRRPTFDYFETSWDWEGTSEEALSDITGHIEVFGGNPDREAIIKILARYEKNGVIQHTTYVEEGVIVWEC